MKISQNYLSPTINSSTVLDIPIQKLLIASTHMITIPSKINKSVSEPSLIDVFDRDENKNINIDKVGLLVEQKSIQVEDIPTGYNLLKILLREVSKVDQQKRLHNNSLNVFSVDQINIPYYLRRNP